MSAPGMVLTSQPHDAISERAADFLARRSLGSWSDADQAELDAWLAESAAHRVAWLRVEGAVARSRALFALRPPKLSAAKPAVERRLNYRRFLLHRFVPPLLAAASIALVVTLGLPAVRSLMEPSDRIDSTDIGGRTLLKFVDGTQVELNTDTVMRFRMTNEERTVWLERGEAWFHVAHDAAHPFTVVVGRHRITDLGTEFLVRRDEDEVEVALVNGRAALSAEGVQTATLNPGDDAVATPVSLSVTHKTPQQLADALAWQRGMLVFRDAPLAQVVREFNRYNQVKLVIADPSIADETITANAKTDDYESFLQLAETVLKLRVAREGSIILISRGPREETKAVHIKHGA